MLVSLPKEWIDANGLGKGSQVELDAGQDSVSVSANPAARPTREIVISYPLPEEENIVADITGAYLLGFDVIKIDSVRSIPARDREEIRNSMRRLVGMEIIEEDASHINMQFLLDAATLNPDKILKRMSSIALGMYDEVVRGLVSDDKSDLQTISKRDVEVNRQYFLLVRLIRSTIVDKRLASAFNLENVDVLDYRVAASLLERAGDSIVLLSRLVLDSPLSRDYSVKIFDSVRDFERLGRMSVDAFTKPDRLLAIQAISLHKKFEGDLIRLRTTLDREQIPLEFIDLVYMFERITQSWEDLADLVKPIYK